MTEKEFLEYVVAFCKRPRMYTPTGTFFEIVSLVDGFGSGAIDMEEVQGFHSALAPFQKWLAGRYESDTRFPLSWQDLRAHFDSDEEALRTFPLLYEEYLRDQETNG